MVQQYREDQQNSKFLRDNNHTDFIFYEITSLVDSHGKDKSSIFFLSMIKMQINEFAQ